VVSSRAIDVIAHRGGDGEWPGETTLAFTRALANGANVIEMDVWGTADDPPVLVLMHSSDISKMTEGRGDVRSLHFKEDLENLNAAYQWSPDGGATFPFRNHKPVLRVAKLDDVLKEFKDHRMNIEIKQKRPSIVKPFLDAIERAEVPAQNLLIASFHTAVLKDFRRECKQRNLQIATSASTWEWVRFYFGNYLLHLPYRPPAEVVQMAERLLLLRIWLLSRAFIRKAHNTGLTVHAWTVDDPDDMKRAIANGVDGIITDFPTRLRAILDDPDRSSALSRGPA
jgi:glycerophosphoryl diester phosphodiesterase